MHQSLPASLIIRPAMPELDSLRGLAVLMVLFFHGFGMLYGLDGLNGITKWFVAATLTGWAGVNLFFVLSGFLITGILIKSRSNQSYYKRFYFRRALRILPAYYAFLLVFACFSFFIAKGHPASFITLSALYLANLSPLFGVVMLYAPLWTLAVEEHFYLLWPFVVKHHVAAYLSCCIVVACPILRAFAFLLGYKGEASQFTWFVADGLALGSLFSICLQTRVRTRRQLAFLGIGVLFGSVSVFLIGSPFGIVQSSRLLGASLRTTVLNFFFVSVLAAFLYIGTGQWKRLVNSRILRFFGDISYGLYLIHLFIFDAFNRLVQGIWSPAQGDFKAMTVRFICAGGISVVIAWLSRWYFEEQFLKLKNKWFTSSKSAVSRVAYVPVNG
jgi:peptidoglycan/LPS O-acetylase OafA/YrhL